jgi:hypothetical protein
MDKSSKEFLDKKENLLELLHYIDDHNLWNTAKHLITYIEKSGNADLKFLNLISDLIAEAISNTDDKVSKKKLEEVSDMLEKLKKEEKLSNEQDQSEADSLLNEINI